MSTYYVCMVYYAKFSQTASVPLQMKCSRKKKLTCLISNSCEVLEPELGLLCQNFSLIIYFLDAELRLS